MGPSLDDILDAADALWIGLATKTAEAYQYITGKSKNDLIPFMHAGDSALFCAAAGLWAYTDNYWMVLPGGLSALHSGALAATCKYRLRRTENIPDDPDPLSQLIGVLSIATDLSLLAIGLYLTSVGYFVEHDPKQTAQGIGTLAFTFGFFGYSLATYMERADIDPPSGKSVFARLKEKVKSMIPEPGLRQPVPNPLPIQYINTSYLDAI